MTALNRILLVRHGETVGQSSIRYYGSTDVPLSQHGREQMRRLARRLPSDVPPLVLSSPMMRAWQSARLVAPHASIRLRDELREIDFGRWEGLTAEEIRARDPILFEDWRAKRPGFEFPGGERRAHLQARVDRVTEDLLASGRSGALVVAHKAVVRAVARRVAGEELPEDLPALAGCIQLTRDVGGHWFVGRHSSDPREDGTAAAT